MTMVESWVDGKAKTFLAYVVIKSSIELRFHPDVFFMTVKSANNQGSSWSFPWPAALRQTESGEGERECRTERG